MEILKARARIEILNYITSFCLSRNYGDGINRGGLGDNYFEPADDPDKGDLINLQSAPFSIYYLSWYKERIGGSGGCFDEHLIQSIETGEYCKWSNVSFYRLNRKIVDNNPQWRWTDKQFKFQDRWHRACRRKYDHINLPCQPIFNKDGSVVLLTRRRFGTEEKSRRFNDWEKVLVRDMLQFYESLNKQ